MRVLWLLMCLSLPVEAVPRAALAHQRLLTAEAHRLMGLGAPVPVLAGQIHAESGWRDQVRSPVGAEGMAQFMPATTKWIREVYPAELGVGNPWQPAWAIRAMILFDRRLLRTQRGHTECDQWWFVLRSYNGGEGHLNREKRGARDPLDRKSVDLQCGTARRSVIHCPENLGYPVKILKRYQPRYSGWGRMVKCQERS